MRTNTTAAAGRQPARAPALSAAEVAERDRVVAAALAEGRIVDAATWRARWGADPVGSRHLLTAAVADGGLAPDSAFARPSLDRVRESMGLRSSGSATTTRRAARASGDPALERARRALGLRVGDVAR